MKSWFDCEVGGYVANHHMPHLAADADTVVLTPPSFGFSGRRPKARRFQRSWCRSAGAVVWERLD